MSGFTSAGTRARPSLTSGLTARRLFFPFLLTSAVSSLAINLRNARDDFRQLQSRHAARLSVLNGIIDKLESGQHVRPDFIAKEYERVGIVERAGVVDAKKQDSNVGWKEMLLGRKRTEQDRAQDARELRDIEEAIEKADYSKLAGKSTAIRDSNTTTTDSSSPVAATYVKGAHPNASTTSAPRSILI